MATKLPAEAIAWAKELTKSMPLERVSTDMINRVLRKMWMFAPWRWTVGSIPTITLVANTQDYTINYPADWLYAISAYVTDGTNNEKRLEVVSALPTAVGFVGIPSKIAYTGTAGQSGGPVRISPKPSQVTGTQVVVGLYKKAMTAYTNKTQFTTVLPFDDEWYHVFEDGILWQAYLYADDRKAGEAVVSNNKIQYSGQRAVFEAGLLEMAQREKLALIDPYAVDTKETNT